MTTTTTTTTTMTKKVPTVIVTHPGQAHRDDLMAVAVALAVYPVGIVHRREPTPSELSDPGVLVLDVGGQYDPEKGNFDHHQLPRDAAPACALSLFIEALGLTEGFGLLKWWEATKVADSKGPYALAERVGVTPDALFALGSPVERGLLALFEEVPPKSPLEGGSPLFEVLRAIGADVLEYVTSQTMRRAWLLANAQVVVVGGHTALLVPDKDSAGVQAFRDEVCPGCAISISYDDRGVGWALYRFNDSPGVDFSRLAQDPRVLFAHNGGFIAKTRERVSFDEVVDLVKLALT